MAGDEITLNDAAGITLLIPNDFTTGNQRDKIRPSRVFIYENTICRLQFTVGARDYVTGTAFPIPPLDCFITPHQLVLYHNYFFNVSELPAYHSPANLDLFEKFLLNVYCNPLCLGRISPLLQGMGTRSTSRDNVMTLNMIPLHTLTQVYPIIHIEGRQKMRLLYILLPLQQYQSTDFPFDPIKSEVTAAGWLTICDYTFDISERPELHPPLPLTMPDSFVMTVTHQYI